MKRNLDEFLARDEQELMSNFEIYQTQTNPMYSYLEGRRDRVLIFIKYGV